MTDFNQLVEQHIREHQARRERVDALAQQASAQLEQGAADQAARRQLAELLAERDRLVVRVDEFRLKSAAQWREEEIERAGLMGVWDALAQQLEQLIERLEGRR